MAAKSFAVAAAQLQQILGPDAPVIGGLAVNAYGFIRATQDVDILVRMPLAQAQKLLEAHGIRVELHRGDPLEGDFSCLSGVIGVQSSSGRTEGVVFDILPERVPVRPDRLVRLSLHGHSLQIVDLETLIRLKLKAGGPRDLYDIGVLAHLNHEAKQAALAHAAHKPRLLARVQRNIDDPHTIAKVVQLRRGERLLRAFARDQDKRTDRAR
jgi:hypothetical protein